ncbi:sensor histidine kinase [Subtercola sp. YIM 133946]|uniref:sensor histidine kinase n=1 Tax=Subtercola sp. YIM 133946 TaxID=3118909 RepID=UPI002F95A73C
MTTAATAATTTTAAPATDPTAVPAELESTLTRLRGALSRSTVERILTRAAAVFGLLFSLQAIPLVTASQSYVDPVWLEFEPGILLLSLVVVVIAAILQRGVRASMIAFAALYFVAFVCWPLCVPNVTRATGTQPWLWSLIAVAMAYVAVALPVLWAGVYIVAVTAVYVFVHILPAGGSGTLKGSLLDAVYVLLIGAFMLMLMATLRRAANRVDAAQSTAMQQYARAALGHATEVERTKIDAFVHDSVLTTLITAARAETATERHAAAVLAAEALETLQEAPGAFDPDADVSQAEFARRLADAVLLLSPRVSFSAQTLPQHTLPGIVADALFTAAVQAVINSLQHAGDVDGAIEVMRTVSVHAEGDEVTVQVSDTGLGFDVDAVPKERLGLRVSIRQRVESVGGTAVVHSLAGSGTTVLIGSGQPATRPLGSTA